MNWDGIQKEHILKKGILFHHRDGAVHDQIGGQLLAELMAHESLAKVLLCNKESLVLDAFTMMADMKKAPEKYLNKLSDAMGQGMDLF